MGVKYKQNKTNPGFSDLCKGTKKKSKLKEQLMTKLKISKDQSYLFGLNIGSLKRNENIKSKTIVKKGHVKGVIFARWPHPQNYYYPHPGSPTQFPYL